MIDADHIVRRMRESELKTDPFPYIYVENVFAEKDYEHLLRAVPKDEQKHDRTILDCDAGFGADFMSAVLGVFGHATNGHRADTRLVLDREGYGIPPHTDKVTKAISLLFYLPVDNSDESIGTSIYVPLDPSLRCRGGKVHKIEKFKTLWTAPFRRNSMFGFWKTDNSFHGVEKITRPITRNVLLYNVYVEH